jgi:hypothetical protein
MIKKPKKRLLIKKEDTLNKKGSTRNSAASDIDVDNVTYYELLSAFLVAGCFKFQVGVDNTMNLVNKFR